MATDNRRINLPMLLRVLGWLLLIESAFMAVPAIVAYCCGENDWKVLAFTAALTLCCGDSLTRWIKTSHTSLGKRDGFLLTAMVWVVFSIFGMIPLWRCSTPLSFTDSFLEAIAGFTTTGISLYADPSKISHGITLWRAMMQWIGGLGIILFTLAVLPMLNSSGGMQLFNAEVTGITHEKIRPRISQTAKSLWFVYLALSVICFALLYVGPMGFFDSVCHAMGTVSTGGFTTRQMGVCDWDSDYIYIVVTIFMFLGGTSFSLIYFAAIGKWRSIKHNATFMTYLAIVLGSAVVFVISIVAHGQVHSISDITIFPLFQVVSTITSTGYTMPGLYSWGPIALAVLVPLMFIGGCAGSTSGGVKVDRIVVLSRYVRNTIKRVLQPNYIVSVKVDGRILPTDTVSKVIAFLCIYCIIICTGALLLAAMDVPFLDSFFCSLSCVTNLGVGADVAGLGQGVESVPEAGRWLLAMLMLIGRLEVFTILILFMPSFWHK